MLTLELAYERETRDLVVGLVLDRGADLLLRLDHDVDPLGGREGRVVLEYVVEYLGVVLAAARPVDLHLGYDAVLARAARAHDRVDARPIGSILHDERGVGAHLIDVRASHARVRAAVLELQVGDLQRILIERVLYEATFETHTHTQTIRFMQFFKEHGNGGVLALGGEHIRA